MKLKELVPELVVENVERSIDFYKNMLDFEVITQVLEEGTPIWAELANESVRLMVQSRYETQTEKLAISVSTIGGTMLLVFRFESYNTVHNLWARLARWEHVVFPLRETDYGTIEFSVTDPDGYVLIFAG